MTQGELPWGWQRVTCEKRESGLEPLGRPLDELLAIVGVSLDELERWRGKGWISFDASTLDTLLMPQWAELIFIRNLANSYLTDAQTAQLLSELEPPYKYDPTRTAYSFAFGWVWIPLLPDEAEVDEFVHECLQEWIAAKARLGQFDLLTELESQIISSIARYGPIAREGKTSDPQ